MYDLRQTTKFCIQQRVPITHENLAGGEGSQVHVKVARAVKQDRIPTGRVNVAKQPGHKSKSANEPKESIRATIPV